MPNTKGVNAFFRHFSLEHPFQSLTKLRSFLLKGPALERQMDSLAGLLRRSSKAVVEVLPKAWMPPAASMSFANCCLTSNGAPLALSSSAASCIVRMIDDDVAEFLKAGNGLLGRTDRQCVLVVPRVWRVTIKLGLASAFLLINIVTESTSNFGLKT